MHEINDSSSSLFCVLGAHFLHLYKEFPILEAGPRNSKILSQTKTGVGVLKNNISVKKKFADEVSFSPANR